MLKLIFILFFLRTGFCENQLKDIYTSEHKEEMDVQEFERPEALQVLVGSQTYVQTADD
jgi:hypothetical protein